MQRQKSFRGKPTAAWLRHGDGCLTLPCLQLFGPASRVSEQAAGSSTDHRRRPVCPWGRVRPGQNRPVCFLSRCPAKRILRFLSPLAFLQSSDFLGFSSPRTSAFQLFFSLDVLCFIFLSECHFVIFQLVCADSFYPHWRLQQYCL